MAFQDLMQALNNLNQGMTELSAGRAIRSASEQAQMINMNEQDQFKKNQAFTQLGQGLAAQLSSIGASPTQVQQASQIYMPKQLTSPADFFAQAAQATSPEAAQQYQQAGQQVQAGLASAPLTTAQNEQFKIQKMQLLNERMAAAGLAKAGGVTEKEMHALNTPFGLANTIDDAKQLKTAYESKKTFDSKIDEMIALRRQYGAEQFNREAVERGKQLSKDLLLEYKNMAKLGVLSKSDEDIINAIIPKDPLEFKFSSFFGQDPIMNNLVKFKQDSTNDFANRVRTRTRAGMQQLQQGNLEGQIPQEVQSTIQGLSQKFNNLDPEQQKRLQSIIEATRSRSGQ